MKSLKIFLIFLVLLSLISIFFNLKIQIFKKTLIEIYKNQNFTFDLHQKLLKQLSSASSNNLKNLIPHRFNWSNWASSDAKQLEDSLIILNRNLSFKSSSSDSDRHRSDLLKSSSGSNQSLFHGLYLFNPNSSSIHPILELIRQSNQAWNQKLLKSSKTLNDAIKEYRRRYNRPPPFGFENWWKFAVSQNVIIKDEYDQILKDLKPFLAIQPSDLSHRSFVMANERPETFTISLKSNQLAISGTEAHLDRAKDFAKLLSLFVHQLPSDDKIINMTFTKHDQPAVQMTWSTKQKMIDLADVGEYFSPSEYVRPPNSTLSNWANACPPNSNLYLNESNIPSSNSFQIGKSFIFDHQSAMEICSHPESMQLHGFTSSPGTNNAELVPLFTFAKSSTQSDILAPPLEQYSDTYIGNDPVWSKKTINKLLWRGSTTGAEFKKGFKWRESQRARLHFLTHKTDGKVQVLSPSNQTKLIERDLAQLNQKLMDTSFSGRAVQCDPETCQHLSQIINFAPTMGLDESYQYKYLIDLDGNGWSGRFHRLMSTNSIVLKSTIFPEWYADRVQPWVHYVPIKVDYSDLYDAMLFFAGDLDGSDSHDQLAEMIANQGKDWAAKHWRRVDMAAYAFRLVLEWRRIMLRGTDAQLDYIEN
ncbi:hypothetical protein O181_089941 [Austropuccinia psidii MF-1]|uniref:Glycosyl transferase CAP10 domain-containing protein n=1 Tax=Austropuccinia psidii MF-1 TaxID=1389203 RepID=A0A9Q3IUF4_9BASI|nr:hypothetical protein [Austropuccinia psidii MF-1]